MAAGFNYDLIVIGGGPIGLSTAYHAAKNGLTVAVFDQYSLINDHGASAGASRQFRLQYAVQYMSELCLASLPFWADLQQHATAPLIGKDGSLWFGDPSLDTREGGIKPAETVMDKLGIPYTKLDAQQIEKSYNFRNVDSKYRGFFQGDGGIINLTATQQALVNANIHNARLVDMYAADEVTSIKSGPGNRITVTAGGIDWNASMLAVTASGWVNDLVKFFGIHVPISIWEMSSAYFKVTDSSKKYETWFYYGGDKNDFYGFPAVDWPHPGYIRVAPDFPDRIIQTPFQRTGKPDKQNLALTSQFIAQHMTGVDSKPVFASTCIAPLADNPDQELLIDYPPSSVPNHKKIVVYTGGWAGKFVPILGDMIYQMLTSSITSFKYGDYTFPLSNFAIDWKTLPQRRRIR
jgi:glycine/D-amino acid oxidase-like deaminating enzyme